MERDEARAQRDDARKQLAIVEKRAEGEREARLTAEAEIARLREELAKATGQS